MNVTTLSSSEFSRAYLISSMVTKFAVCGQISISVHCFLIQNTLSCSFFSFSLSFSDEMTRQQKIMGTVFPSLTFPLQSWRQDLLVQYWPCQSPVSWQSTKTALFHKSSSTKLSQRITIRLQHICIKETHIWTHHHYHQ